MNDIGDAGILKVILQGPCSRFHFQLSMLQLHDRDMSSQGVSPVSNIPATIAALRPCFVKEAVLCLSHNYRRSKACQEGSSSASSSPQSKPLGHGLPPAPADTLPSCPMQIASALEGDSSLVSLDVGGNNIEATGITALANALKGNANLKSLELGYNPIREKGAQALADVVKYDLKVSLEAALLLKDALCDLRLDGTKALVSVP